MRLLALSAVLALALPAAAQEDCPRYDIVADTSSGEVATTAEVTGWAKAALKARYEEGAPCFVFVAIISAENASAMYASFRASVQGERVVRAETQTVVTGSKAQRRTKLKKELAGWIAEKAPPPAAAPAASGQR